MAAQGPTAGGNVCPRQFRLQGEAIVVRTASGLQLAPFAGDHRDPAEGPLHSAPGPFGIEGQAGEVQRGLQLQGTLLPCLGGGWLGLIHHLVSQARPVLPTRCILPLPAGNALGPMGMEPMQGEAQLRPLQVPLAVDRALQTGGAGLAHELGREFMDVQGAVPARCRYYLFQPELQAQRHLPLGLLEDVQVLQVPLYPPL